jgi:probable HAF family extracellular repeat protein
MVKRLNLFAVSLWLASSGIVQSQSYYTVTDLGYFGYSGQLATGLNDSGQAVGYANVVGGYVHAFLYTNGAWLDLQSAFGTNYSTSYAYGINDSGQISGYAYNNTANQNHPFLYANGAVLDLGLSSTNDNQVYGPVVINKTGQIAVGGMAGYNPTGGYLYQLAATYQNGWTVLGALASHISAAQAINDSGQMVGSSDTATYQHAVLFANGAITDLGTPPVAGFPASVAVAINNAGLVAGYVTSTNSSSTEHAAIFANGVITDLHPLVGGYESYANAVSDSGQVLFTQEVLYTNSGFNYYYSTNYLYSNGSVTNLNSLVNPASGWSGIAGSCFNHKGQILGDALGSDGNIHILILTPPSAAPTAPQLSVAALPGKQVLLSWPSSATGYRLETNSSLAPAFASAWASATGTAVISGNNFVLTNNIATAPTFYRLISP